MFVFEHHVIAIMAQGYLLVSFVERRVAAYRRTRRLVRRGRCLCPSDTLVVATAKHFKVVVPVCYDTRLRAWMRCLLIQNKLCVCVCVCFEEAAFSPLCEGGSLERPLLANKHEGKMD